MSFTLNYENDFGLVSIEDTIVKNAQMSEVLDCVRPLARQGKSYFILDMHKVKFMNSCAVGMLLTCLLECEQQRGEFILAGVSNDVLRILEANNLKSKFLITTSVEEGKAILKTHRLKS